MTGEWLTVLLLVAATHRVTRFVVADALAERRRLAVQSWWEQRWEDAGHVPTVDEWGSRAAYALSCSWCLSMYVGAVLTAATAAVASVPLPVLTVLAASSVTGLLSRYDSG